MFENLLRRAFFVDDAFVHEEDAGADVLRDLHLVRHDEHGHALFRQLADDAQHFAHHRGVEGGGGLVEEDDFRFRMDR